MEYRQSTRIPGPEVGLDEVVDDAGPRPRFRRFTFTRPERRLDPTRFVAAVVVSIIVIFGLSLLGAQAINGVREWVQSHPQFQLPFTRIQLMDPPPPWYRGGAEGFLKQVRDNARESDLIPVLRIEEKRIRNAFKLSPWVRDVLRVEYPPHLIRVRLTYHVPVARLVYGPGDEDILDAEGHRLPVDDLDPEKLGPLVLIVGDHKMPIAAPGARSPGLVWKPGSTGPDADVLERNVLAAARLASFLLESERGKDATLVQGMRILASYPQGLFLHIPGRQWVLWDEAPGDEGGTRLSLEEKWTLLDRWRSRPAEPEESVAYWAIGRTGLMKVLRPARPR